MRSLVGCLALLVLILGARPTEACSPVPTSPLKQYNTHSLIFLGTVRAQAKAPENAYTIAVEEPFKGFASDTKLPSSIDVVFNIRGPCGFDAPKPGTRVLVYMNEGDVVSIPSGSRFLWSESAQTAPHLNPVWDDVILLRGMLKSGPIVADADTAIHLALKALKPLHGAEALAKKLPLEAKFNADGKTFDERIWTVRAKGGAPLVELNKWTGDVIRIEPKG